MSWPAGPDYSDAIQNPQANLRDPCLRRGTVVTTRLGLPAVDSGNFASVFQVVDRTQRWAVKCFTRKTHDQQERYRAISDHLKARPVSFTVDFEYQKEGILVRGAWYPILRMEWIDGPLLDAYVRKHLLNSSALRQLAEKWCGCISDLQESGMAHGDLQIGNIKILGSDIRLIDYDGMYVPALENTESSENGHPNFQHPGRTGKHFGPYIDNFPAWVIYASLHALAEYPAIWGEVDGGDDCLIFRKADFEAPSSSRVFAELDRVGSSRLKDLLRRLRNYSQQPVQRVPPLGDPRSHVEQVLPRPPSLAPGRLPEWIPPDSIEGPDGVCSEPQEALARVLRGKELITSQYIFVVMGVMAVVGCLVGAVANVSIVVILYLVGTASAGATLLITLQYYAFRSRAGIVELEREIIGLGKQLASLEWQKRDWDRQCTEIQNHIRDAEAEVASHVSQVTLASQAWDAKVAAAHNARDKALQEIARKAADNLAHKQAEVENLISAERTKLALLDVHRDERLCSLLHRHRSEFIDKALQEHELRYVQFEGLGEILSSRLSKAGFRSAFDVLAKNPRVISGIGTGRAYALEAWAREMRSRAEMDAPKHLPLLVKNEVLAECALKRLGLEDNIKSLEEGLARITQSSQTALLLDQQRLRQQCRSEEERLGRERYSWEQQARKRREELEASLQEHQSEYIRLTAGLASGRERLVREEKAIAGRHADCKREYATFNGLSLIRFLKAVVQLA